MSDNPLSHFGPLDELIQVIYQGHLKFVVLSSVDEVSWTVHVGLSGEDGRWWRGRWKEGDVRNTVGSKASSRQLDSFADGLVDAIVQGELHIGNWSAEKGASIDLTFGAGSKSPVHLPLTELATAEAASFATKVFTEIALQAQSRKCRLHPSSYSPPPTTSRAPRSAVASSSKPPSTSFRTNVTKTDTDAAREISRLKSELAEARSSHSELHSAKPARSSSRGEGSSASSSKLKEKREHSPEAQREIKKLKAALSRTETQRLENEGAAPDTAKLKSIAKGTGPAGQNRKGASLANPGHKRRKYQELEFASDDD